MTTSSRMEEKCTKKTRGKHKEEKEETTIRSSN